MSYPYYLENHFMKEIEHYIKKYPNSFKEKIMDSVFSFFIPIFCIAHNDLSERWITCNTKWFRKIFNKKTKTIAKKIYWINLITK